MRSAEVITADAHPLPLQRHKDRVVSRLQRPLLKAHLVVDRKVWIFMAWSTQRGLGVSASVLVILQSILTTTS